MGGFNPPVPQQDSNWEIRAAVLLSLFFQVLLIFLGPMRKRSSAPMFRLTVWSCYLLADWVADLALGLLLNNMGNIGGNNDNNATAGSNSSPVIFAFWTPFLLLHLGGPDTITAYSVEDNELWNRHLIGLLFELFSASVIIFCSLRGNPLVPATMLMLVAGVIKYGERTYSLYYGSVENLRDSILGAPDPGPDYARLMTELDSKRKAGLVAEIGIGNGEAAKVYGEMEKQKITRLAALHTKKSVEGRAYELFLIFRRLLVDAIVSFKQRRLSQAFFLEGNGMTPLTPMEAFEVVEAELNFMYGMVYTKDPAAYSTAGWVLRSICSGCLVSALIIFFHHDKGGMQPIDVRITYALLLGGLALDAIALLMLFFSDRMKVILEEPRRLSWLARLRKKIMRWGSRRWSWRVSQLNLIRYCLEKPGHYSSNDTTRRGGKWWLMIVKMLGIEEIVDDMLFIRRALVSQGSNLYLLDFLFYGLKDMASQELKRIGKEDIIMEMFNSRGKRVIEQRAMDLKNALLVEDKFKVILDSVVKSDFEESLLLWHIATDLCLYMEYEGPMSPASYKMRVIGEILSEYMLYLLIKQPEMLSATAGIGFRPYRDTCAEARRFFASKAKWNPNHEDMRRMLLSVNTSQKPSVLKGGDSKSVLFDAVILAKTLRQLDEELMWMVVTGVWGEMLTYAAVRGRGRTHVRSLNRGGELITLVWLHMGLSDMYEIGHEEPRVKLFIQY